MRPKARLAAAISRMIDEFGATALVQLPDDHVPLSQRDRILSRRSVHQEHAGHVWFPAGGAQAAFVWDWEMGPELDIVDHMRWRGRQAKMLRTIMSQAGFDRDRCAYLSLAAEPSPEDGRQPPVFEHGVIQALRAADTRFVILVGSAAHQLWHPDVKLTDVQGRIGIWRQWYVMSIMHPNAVLRGLIEGIHWKDHLARFRQAIDDGDGYHLLNPWCIECGDEVYVYDKQGIAHCRRHVNHAASLRKEKVKTYRDDCTLDLSVT